MTLPAANTNPNACNLNGTLTPETIRLQSMVNALDSHVKIVLNSNAGPLTCNIGGKLVITARSFGRSISDINFSVDRSTGAIIQLSSNNVDVNRNNAAADPLETALVNQYTALSAPLANRVVGSITEDINDTLNPTVANGGNGESAIGDVIADAQLAVSGPAPGNAVVAFMNPGGIRSPLFYNQISGGEQPGEVTYGETFTVQPFSNLVVTMTLTGAQLKQVLEQQFNQTTGAVREILQVSDSIRYTYDITRPIGDEVDASTIMINGAPLNPAASYRVTVNNFLAGGGDSFSSLLAGTNLYFGSVDLDALNAYLGAHSPVAPGPKNRITRLH